MFDEIIVNSVWVIKLVNWMLMFIKMLCFDNIICEFWKSNFVVSFKCIFCCVWFSKFNNVFINSMMKNFIFF